MTGRYNGSTERKPVYAATSRPSPLQPTRNPVTPSGDTFRGKHKSLKGANAIKCESLLELRADDLLEFAKSVGSYVHQPPRMRIRVDDRWRRYTPDRAAMWCFGGLLLVEVKPRLHARTDAMRRKFAAIREAAERNGDRFVVLTEEQIHREGTRDLRRLLDIRRDWIVENLGGPPTDESLDAVAASLWEANAELRDAVTNNGRLSLGAAHRLLGDDDDAVAQVDLLLAARILAWPIKRALTKSTLLHCYSEDDDEQLFV